MFENLSSEIWQTRVPSSSLRLVARWRDGSSPGQHLWFWWLHSWGNCQPPFWNTHLSLQWIDPLLTSVDFHEESPFLSEQDKAWFWVKHQVYLAHGCIMCCTLLPSDASHMVLLNVMFKSYYKITQAFLRITEFNSFISTFLCAFDPSSHPYSSVVVWSPTPPFNSHWKSINALC